MEKPKAKKFFNSIAKLTKPIPGMRTAKRISRNNKPLSDEDDYKQRIGIGKGSKARVKLEREKERRELIKYAHESGQIVSEVRYIIPKTEYEIKRLYKLMLFIDTSYVLEEIINGKYDNPIRSAFSAYFNDLV